MYFNTRQKEFAQCSLSSKGRIVSTSTVHFVEDTKPSTMYRHLRATVATCTWTDNGHGHAALTPEEKGKRKEKKREKHSTENPEEKERRKKDKKEHGNPS